MNLFVCYACKEACDEESNSCAACSAPLCDNCWSELPRVCVKTDKSSYTEPICWECDEERKETLVDKVHRFAKQEHDLFMEFLEQHNVQVDQLKMEFFKHNYDEKAFINKFKNLK